MRNTGLMAMLAVAAMAAQAQGVYYQSVMPDGRVVVGDKPTPGAREVRQIPLRQGNISAPLSNPAGAGTANVLTPKQAAEVADGEIADAKLQLQTAKAALEAGREPKEGERAGTAGGGSRLTDAYFKRIKALEDGVSAAQNRLDAAGAQRNTSR